MVWSQKRSNSTAKVLKIFSQLFELQLDCFNCNTPRQHCWDPNMKRSWKRSETCCVGERSFMFILFKLHGNTHTKDSSLFFLHVCTQFQQLFLACCPSQVLRNMDPGASIEPGSRWERWWFHFTPKQNLAHHGKRSSLFNNHDNPWHLCQAALLWRDA